MKKILLTGGGTVGHVTLNLLLIPRLIDDGWEVHYIGDKRGIEYQQIQQSGYPVTFHGISTGKLRRYFSWENVKDVFKVGWGVLQSLFIMLRVRPQVLFSKGGFVSVPPVIAARVAGVPVFIHESDLSMGLANKIAYKFATKMYTTFEQAESLARVKHIGAVTKVSEKTDKTPDELRPILANFDDQLPTLLFVGGSGGAKVFNDLISEHKLVLTQSYNIINLTGDESLEELSQNLYRVGYVTSLYQPLMELADVVVTRGGSNTIFELLAMQKLHLIVPLGKKASRGDQLENAAYFEKKGYALTLPEEELTVASLNAMVTQLLSQREVYETTMRQSQEIQTLDSFYQLLMADIETIKK
ncbi:UDP-N-acetylglucosamine--N-acetylmuramyl-(pentapeptide) pyrophosphoryl-undecaprenol N-acetylglucosamine transferase [Streptococcus merionis]|uniref:UDP-N-acetylglucosamine--N-acetylmuramyl-(pentapeptide) pyrophosphoryl-undecaprenol N-acetylglucosamine transferase n=1 Tax=Streptococcus merionis TaxID=400065 RepID=A0A239SKR2_9STRE|nr:UDP-N-acetylglucosamine--N-acetylmuramyl-(pentapeptide) pyrophosphoryl-undecaprenol N-acetylglucosamine transferase [Streptococcus merionis]SNU86025.1 UDP-N-acetylglucosamine:LPS N-acetylglucosamine transferase [Streptococcus merionis]